MTFILTWKETAINTFAPIALPLRALLTGLRSRITVHRPAASGTAEHLPDWGIAAGKRHPAVTAFTPEVWLELNKFRAPY